MDEAQLAQLVRLVDDDAMVERIRAGDGLRGGLPGG